MLGFEPRVILARRDSIKSFKFSLNIASDAEILNSENSSIICFMPSDPRKEEVSYAVSGMPKPRRSLIYVGVIVVIVIIIIVVGVVNMNYLPSGKTHTFSTPNFGFISDSTLEKMIRVNLTQSEILVSTNLPNISKKEVEWYNDSSSRIMIILNEFTNTSYSQSLYDTVVRLERSAIKNMSYDGFTYFIENFSLYNSWIAEGFKMNFYFIIDDESIPISNFNAIVQAEISAIG